MAFTLPLEDYSRNYDIIGEYRRLMIDGLKRTMKLSNDAATRKVDTVLENHDFTKYVARFAKRKDNGDREIVECNLLDYIKNVENKGLIMSPTMTTYLPPETKASICTQVIEADQSHRSRVKKEAQTAKQKGDVTGEQIGTGIQNAIKRLVNSWSGAGLSPHTPLYLPSLHPTLTTMCRISTALATASVERLVSGNRYYHTPDRVIEDILTITNYASRSKVERSMHLYNLKVPTINELMAIVDRGIEFYWKDEFYEEHIRNLLNALEDWEKVAFAYTGDFYHMFLYNDIFIREMLDDTLSEDNSQLANVKDYAVNELDEDQSVLLTNLIGEEIKGKKLKDALEENPTIAARANKIANSLLNVFTDKYQYLIETFFRVPTFPIDIGRQDKAIRRAVSLGDTDSTVYTTKDISQLYYKRVGFEKALEPINDIMVYFINGVIAHALGNFTGQLNVPLDRRKLLVMKNEFKFPSVQLTPVAKTYHAMVKAEEGNVYNDPKWEMKGQRFHAGRGNQQLVKELHNWMMENKIKLNEGGKIDRGELIDMICQVEGDLVESLHRKDNVYFSMLKIKPKDEYNNAMSQEWGKHRLFELMWSSTHGKTPDPIYTAYKIPLLFPNGVEAWYRTLTPKLQDAYQSWIDEINAVLDEGKEHPLNKPPTYAIVPTDNFTLYGLPKELIDVVDIRKLAGSALDPHYLNLASMGINLDYDSKGKGVLLSQIIEN